MSTGGSGSVSHCNVVACCVIPFRLWKHLNDKLVKMSKHIISLLFTYTLWPETNLMASSSGGHLCLCAWVQYSMWNSIWCGVIEQTHTAPYTPSIQLSIWKKRQIWKCSFSHMHIIQVTQHAVSVYWKWSSSLSFSLIVLKGGCFLSLSFSPWHV